MPAHKACNVSTSNDEEIFRNHVAAAGVLVGDHRLLEKMTRSFDRPQGAGKRDQFFTNMFPLPDGGGVVRTHLLSQLYVLGKAAKALYFRESGRVVTRGRWFLRSADDGLATRLVAELPSRYMAEGSTLSAIAWRAERKGDIDRGTWLFALYGGSTAYALCLVGRDLPMLSRASKAVPLVWPRQREL